MAEDVGISLNGVKKHITVLKKEGVLSRVGDNRTGHWNVSSPSDTPAYTTTNPSTNP